MITGEDTAVDDPVADEDEAETVSDDVVVGEELDVLEAEELDAEALSWAGSTTQRLPLLQVIPFGQHEFPQDCIGLFSSVVNIGLDGCLVTSCQSRLQSIVEIVLQSLPGGQQMTDCPLLKI